MTEKYNDIIDLPHHVSSIHAPMPVHDRAAQFSPFAALTGYDALIIEHARETEEKRTPDEQRKAEIDRRLKLINIANERGCPVQITYFEQDNRKAGGKYISAEAYFCKVDDNWGRLILDDGREVKISDVWDIQCRLFDDAENGFGDDSDGQYI